MATDSYVYEPLDNRPGANEIRLIRLLPSNDLNSDILCRIFRISLNDSPRYEALSYTWGDLTSPENIHIDDKKHNVTANLALAFRYLRLEDRERILWADALCINQEDLTEKSSQVQMMRSIYLKAQQVVVWLGEEADAGRALAICRHWKDEGTEWGVEGDDAPDKFVPKRYDSTIATREDYEACEALFSRPWWSRTWILQEVIHDNPVRVLIGHLQLDLDDLIDLYPVYRNAILFSSEHLARKVWLKPPDERVGFSPHQETWDGFLEGFEYGFNPIQNIDFFRKRFKDRDIAAGSHLEVLLHFFRHQLATDPRDKIFAFLGMVTQPNTGSKVWVDYSENASKRTVYTDAAKHMLAQPLSFVESAERPVASTGELPSWVPDFTTRRQTISTLMYTVRFDADSGLPPEVYHQAHYERTQPLPNEDRNCLRLISIYVGVITEVVDAHVTRHLSKMDDDRIKLFLYDTNLERRFETIKSKPWPQISDQVNISNTSWGPIWTEAGDIVVVAAGYSVPIVLRKEENHYLFVGICWLINSQIPEPGELGKGTGFSPLMFGSACRELGETTFLEEFLLH